MGSLNRRWEVVFALCMVWTWVHDRASGNGLEGNSILLFSYVSFVVFGGLRDWPSFTWLFSFGVIRICMGTWAEQMANVTYLLLLALPPAVTERKCFFDVVE